MIITQSSDNKIKLKFNMNDEILRIHNKNISKTLENDLENPEKNEEDHSGWNLNKNQTYDDVVFVATRLEGIEYVEKLFDNGYLQKFIDGYVTVHDYVDEYYMKEFIIFFKKKVKI